MQYGLLGSGRNHSRQACPLSTRLSLRACALEGRKGNSPLHPLLSCRRQLPLRGSRGYYPCAHGHRHRCGRKPLHSWRLVARWRLVPPSPARATHATSSTAMGQPLQRCWSSAHRSCRLGFRDGHRTCATWELITPLRLGGLFRYSLRSFAPRLHRFRLSASRSVALLRIRPLRDVTSTQASTGSSSLRFLGTTVHPVQGAGLCWWGTPAAHWLCTWSPPPGRTAVVPAPSVPPCAGTGIGTPTTHSTGCVCSRDAPCSFSSSCSGTYPPAAAGNCQKPIGRGGHSLCLPEIFSSFSVG